MSDETSASEAAAKPDSVQSLLLSIAILLADERRSRDQDDDKSKGLLPTEILLAESGLSFKTIAKIVDKKPDAVRMAIRRHQAKETKK